jgi:hypothetical protein
MDLQESPVDERLNHHLASTRLAGFVLTSGPVSSDGAIRKPIVEAEFVDYMLSFRYN